MLEGDWPRDKVVIMEFPDAEAAREFQESPEYQAIAVDRKAGADAVVLTVRGLKWRRLDRDASIMVESVIRGLGPPLPSGEVGSHR